LGKYEEILASYKTYKKALKPSKDGLPPTKEKQEIDRLERRIKVLESINNLLIEKFSRWAVNASMRNLTEEFLDQPLPLINRARKRKAPS
jgi:hypothetical protein